MYIIGLQGHSVHVNAYVFLSIYCLESSIYFMDLKIAFLLKSFTSMFCFSMIPIIDCFSMSTKSVLRRKTSRIH